MSPSPAKRSLRRFRAYCLTVSLTVAVAITGVAQAAKKDTSRDIRTSRGITLTYSPEGFWSSAPGQLKGSSANVGEILADLNKNERNNAKIPQGYTFSAGPQGQLILSSSSKGKPVLPQQAGPASGLKFENMSPAGVVPQPYVKRIAEKGKPVPIPPLPVEKRTAAVESPSPSVPKALPYKSKTEGDVPAPAKPSVERSGPKLIADAPPSTPLALPAPKPAIPAAPAGGSINGIPADMQKSFLSRNKSVFMIFDKDKGTWTSSPGALKDEASADEWCKRATDVDQTYGRIPAGFSYRHLGGGQVQIKRD